MQLSRDAVLLRIFIGEDDKADHKPLYEAIVLEGRARCILPAPPCCAARSASGTRACFTPPRSSACRRTCRIVIEIVDSEEKIDGFVDAIEDIMGSGLMTRRRSR